MDGNKEKNCSEVCNLGIEEIREVLSFIDDLPKKFTIKSKCEVLNTE